MVSSFLKPYTPKPEAPEKPKAPKKPKKDDGAFVTDTEPKKPANRPKKYDKKRNTLVVGMRFGDLILRRKLPTKKGTKVKPSLRQVWKCECICGKIINVPKYYLIRKPNPKTHCGCKSKSLRTLHNREYRIWIMIRNRTRNPSHVAYKHYKSRGINVCDEWYDMENGFEKFFEEIGPAPSKYHTVDRINNMKDYEPGNVMWATAEAQRANQGDRIGGKTLEEIEEMGYTEEEWIEMVKEGKS